MTVDLHNLANTPGYGLASEALRDAGNWDEHATPEGERRKYTASVEGRMPCYCTVTVYARSEQEAEDLIHDKVSDQQFWGWQYDEGAEDISVDFK